MKDIKTRFAIEGEQKFKSAMSNAAAAIKVLNSEQKLAKAQFQNTGDAEKYAADQARILKEKIEQQKSAVKAATQALEQLSDKGISKNSRQFQQWQTRLNNAQTALVQMETDLQNVGASMDSTSSKADHMSNSLDHIGKTVSFDAVTSGIGKITDKLEAAVHKAKDLGTQLLNSMRESSSWADDLQTDAIVYGMDAEQLQRMRAAAWKFDTSVETIIASQQKLKNNMVKGTKEAKEYFQALGITTQELVNPAHGDGMISGGYRQWEDVFWETGNALMNYGDAVERDVMAQTIFGRSWRELLPLFKAGKEAYYEFMSTQNVVSQENIDKLTALDDAWNQMQTDWNTMKNTIFSELSPSFKQLAETVSSLLKEFNSYLETDEGKQKLNDLGEAVSNLFSNLTDVDFGSALGTAKEALNSLTSGLQWLSKSENLESVKNTLSTLAWGFGLLKVSEGVLTLMKLLSAGKFFFGGTAAAEAAAAGTAAGTAWGSAFASAVMKAAPWLAFAYELLNPAATASNDLDVMFDEKSGRLTTAGWDDYVGSMRNFAETGERDSWVDAMFAVGELFEDLPSIASNFEAVNAIAKFRMGGSQDTESLISALQALGFTRKATDEELGIVKLDSQNVQINTDGAITDENGNRVGFNLKSTNGKTVHKDRKTGKIIEDEPVEVPADVVVPDGTPESILKQIGQVVLPVRLQAVGGGLLSTLLNTMQNLSFFSHENGIWSVPWDGYPALLHRGERVIPAREAVNYNNNNNSSNVYVEHMTMSNGMDAKKLADAIATRKRRISAGYGS